MVPWAVFIRSVMAGLLFLLMGAVAADSGDVAMPAVLPELAAALRGLPEVDFCGERVPLDRPQVRERWEKEMLLTLWDRPQVILWLKRAPRYFPRIEAILAETGLPDDLKYIAVIESALRPHVGSPRGAIGFWQFIPETGRTWGLRIDSRVDERRSLDAATVAAVAYLKALHAQFGTWSLAAAAYNMGEAGLQTEIEQQGMTDYYELYLSLETQRYLLRAVAAKMIFSNPAGYGFDIRPEDHWPPRATENVTLTCDTETPLLVVAQAAEITFKTIKDLNPHIRGYFLAPGTYTLAVPAGAEAVFLERYDTVLRQWRQMHPEIVYSVQPGDHLTAIAERHGVSLNHIILWNRLDPRRPIHPGDTLILYAPPETDPVAAEPSEQP